MAATWEVSIMVTNIAERRIRVTGVRIDGEDVRTYSAQGQVDTNNLQDSLRAIMDTLFIKHTATINEETTKAALISGWEETATTYLEGLET